MSIVKWNLKEAGFGEHTNPRANLWPDEQEAHIRFQLRVRLLLKPKPDNYTESAGINETGRWRERNVSYPGRDVRHVPKGITAAQSGAERAEVSRGHSRRNPKG